MDATENNAQAHSNDQPEMHMGIELNDAPSQMGTANLELQNKGSVILLCMHSCAIYTDDHCDSKVSCQGLYDRKYQTLYYYGTAGTTSSKSCGVKLTQQRKWLVQWITKCKFKQLASVVIKMLLGRKLTPLMHKCSKDC